MVNEEKVVRNLKAFKGLILDTSAPEEIKRGLIEIYVNYTRQIFEYKEKETGIVPFGNIDNHLFILMHLIAVCETEKQYPIFPELTN